MEEFIYKGEGYKIIGCFYTVYNTLALASWNPFTRKPLPLNLKRIISLSHGNQNWMFFIMRINCRSSLKLISFATKKLLLK